MKKIELMSRHEAEDAANKMCQDCPECEYVVYGWQRKQSKKPIFQSPMAMTAGQVNNMRNQYKDVFAIKNPYHESSKIAESVNGEFKTLTDFINSGDFRTILVDDAREFDIHEWEKMMDEDDPSDIDIISEDVKPNYHFVVSKDDVQNIIDKIATSDIYVANYYKTNQFSKANNISPDDIKDIARQLNKADYSYSMESKTFKPGDIISVFVTDKTFKVRDKELSDLVLYIEIDADYGDPVAVVSIHNQWKNGHKPEDNPYKENMEMTEAAGKKLYRYEGALLDMSLDKPFMYTKKPYYVKAYSPKQAILLIKKEIARDIGVDVDDFHLTQLNLYEVSDAVQEETARADFDTCPLCGRRLNDGGTCPVCDDGEEDYESLQTLPEEREICHISDKAEELAECDDTSPIKESITVMGEVLKGDPNIDPDRVFDWDKSPDTQLQKDADDIIAYMIKNKYIPFEIECQGLEIFGGDVKTNYTVEIPSRVLSLGDAGSQVLEHLLETGPAFQEPFTIKDVKEFLDRTKKDIPDFLYDENEDRILEVAEEEYDPYADWESFWEYGGSDD